MAAEAGRLLQQLVGRCPRLLFDERLLTALGHIIAVNDDRSAALGRRDGNQTSLAALMQVTLARASVLYCPAILQHHAMWRRLPKTRAIRYMFQHNKQPAIRSLMAELATHARM